MPMTRPAPVHVRTPATSANLGPGFDALGLALGLYDEVEARFRDDGRTTVEVAGEGAGTLPGDASHLVAASMRAAFTAAGAEPPGVALRCTNRVPHGRGLGSSASAITAGVAIAAAWLGWRGADGGTDRDRVFRTAADIEGHPDNVAPCVYGGFTLSWSQDPLWRSLRVDPSDRLLPIACVPEEELSTEAARGLLPDAVPHADAAFNAGRAGLLVAAVSGHPDLLMDATEDRIHQRYRAPAMPESARLVAELREHDGLPAVVSGAGPTVLVLAAAPGDPGGHGDPERIRARAADSIRARTGTGWHIRPLTIDPLGVRISSPRS